MKNLLKIILILASLFSITVVLPSTQVACGFSQTFELGQGVYTGFKVLDLNVGDRVEGSFSVNNLGPYERLFSGGTSYEVVDVRVIDPNGQTILNFSATPSENSFNFSFTANEQGLYSVGAFSGAMDYLKDAKNPVIIFEFKVLEVPTRINVLSPVNQTYYDSSLFLSFTANKPLSWVGYSLDGKYNMTIDGNTTLTNLLSGEHNVTVYAEDTAGNVGFSETIHFRIEPFPTILVIASVIIVAFVGIVLLVYFKKCKHSKIADKTE
jgi:hypothetical protein